MNVRILLVLLIATVLLSLLPRYRRIGLYSSAALALLVIWRLLSTTAQPATEKTATTIPARRANEAVLPAQLRVSEVELSSYGAPWRLRGVLHNNASTQVRSVKLRITRLQCESPAQADVDCRLIWQGDHSLRLVLQPGASYRFDENIWTHTPVSRASGDIRDAALIVSVD